MNISLEMSYEISYEMCYLQEVISNSTRNLSPKAIHIEFDINSILIKFESLTSSYNISYYNMPATPIFQYHILISAAIP